MTISPGTKLGPYEIESAIGAGGMGEVYKARDTRLDRTVAIKVLPTHLSERPDLKDRFEREAKAISQLSHPHICALYDVGHQEGTDFLVMEYLDGQTLADQLAKEKMTLEQLLRVGTQIAEALDAAHAQGITHRDLKPGNVMLTAAGVKLLDFGLAKMGDIAGGPVAAGLSGLMTEAQSQQPLTAEGTILGTIQYMSPEQLEGKEADARADIFALGAILYEMATGKKAFSGASQASLISSIMSSEPAPISSLDATSPPALDWVIRTCLSKDPNNRFRSAHDLQLQLQWLQEGSSQIGVPAPVARRRVSRERIAWAVTTLLLVAAVFSTAAYLGNRGEKPVVTRTYLPPPDGHLFHFMGTGGPLEIAPDGRQIVFAARSEEEGTTNLWLRPLDALVPHPIAGTEDPHFAFWSPDSRKIAFFSGGKLKKVDAAGGPPIALCVVQGGRGGSWNEEGTIIFGSRGGGIHLVPSAGGESTQITELDSLRGETTHRWPQFLPDGQHFIHFARVSQGSDDNGIWVGSLDGSEHRKLITTQSNAVYADGHLLYLRENTLMAHPFDPGKREFTGEAFPIAERVQFNAPFSRGTFSASGTGVLTYQSGGEQIGTSLAWVDREGNLLGELGDQVIHSDPRISPSGEEVLTVINDPTTGTPDFWIYDVSRGLRTRFTFDLGGVRYAVWSPDGKLLAFSTNAGGKALNIYTQPLHGTTEATPLLETSTDKNPTSFTPDGKYLVYHFRGLGGTWDLGMFPLSGEGEPIEILSTKFHEDGAAISPDGKWMAYASTESGRYEIYVTSFPEVGRKWQISSLGGDFPRWREDGREIYYFGASQGIHACEVAAKEGNFEVGEDRELFPLTNPLFGFPYAVTRDGQKFLIGKSGQVDVTPPAVLVQNWTAELDEE